MLTLEEMFSDDKKSPRLYSDREVYGLSENEIQAKRRQLMLLDTKLEKLENLSKELSETLLTPQPQAVLSQAKARVDQARASLKEAGQSTHTSTEENESSVVTEDMALFSASTLQDMSRVRESLPHLQKKLTQLEKDIDPTLPKSLRKTFTPFEDWEKRKEKEEVLEKNKVAVLPLKERTTSPRDKNDTKSSSLQKQQQQSHHHKHHHQQRRMHTSLAANQDNQRNIWNDFFFNSRSFSKNTNRKQQLIIDPKSKLIRSAKRETAKRTSRKPKRPARIIELVPLGPFYPSCSPSLESVKSFMERLLGIECTMSESLSLTEINKVYNDDSAIFRKWRPVDGWCREGRSGHLQIAMHDVVEVLKIRRKRKALKMKRFEDRSNSTHERTIICSIAVTMAGVYSYHDGEEQNELEFGFGLLKEGTGVFSFARYNPAAHGIPWEGRPSSSNYIENRKFLDHSNDGENVSWSITGRLDNQDFDSINNVLPSLDNIPVRKRSITVFTHETRLGESHCVMVKLCGDEDNEGKDIEAMKAGRRMHPHKLCPVCCRWGHSTSLDVRGTGAGGAVAALLQEFGWMKSDLPPTISVLSKQTASQEITPPSRFVDNYGRRRTRKAGPWSNTNWNQKANYHNKEWANPLQQISILCSPTKPDEIDKWLNKDEHAKPAWPFTSTSWDANGKLMMHDVNPMVLTDKD